MVLTLSQKKFCANGDIGGKCVMSACMCVCMGGESVVFQ